MINKKCRLETHNECKGVVKFLKAGQVPGIDEPEITTCECTCHNTVTSMAKRAVEGLDTIKTELKAEDPPPLPPHKTTDQQQLYEDYLKKQRKGAPVGHTDTLKLKLRGIQFNKGDCVKIAGVPGVFRIHYFTKEPRDGMITVTGWDIGRGQWRTFDAKKI